MAWTLGGNRIYAQKSNEDTGQILPRLQPLSGGTIIQSFGYDSLVRKITAIVVGDTIKDAIKATIKKITPINTDLNEIVFK